MKTWLSLLLLPCVTCFAEHPFDYDFHYTYLPGTKNETMICLHGSGEDYKIAEQIKNSTKIEENLISFNFPDHNISADFDAQKSSYGTIRELLPVLYILKKCVVDEGNYKINLYGYSAGGGALINTLTVLNRDTYDHELEKLSISFDDKQKILKAIQKGYILLDTPLKSMEELIDFRGSSPAFEILAQHFNENDFSPIHSLRHLEGLSLQLIVHFQETDEILSNRDDALFLEKIQKVNLGKTYVLISNDGGHNAFHTSLWDYYLQINPAN
jgi:hypothetical protein